MSPFEEEIANTRDEDEIQAPWPEFPKNEIQAWLELTDGQTVYYYFKKYKELRVIYIMKRKYPYDMVIELPWDHIPAKDMEEFIGLTPGAMVAYLPSGASHISSVAMGLAST